MIELIIYIASIRRYYRISMNAYQPIMLGINYALKLLNEPYCHLKVSSTSLLIDLYSSKQINPLNSPSESGCIEHQIIIVYC